MLRRASVVAVVCLFALCVAVPGQAELRLARIFGDHMVLQRGQAIPVWGWGHPGEQVSVDLAGKTASTEVGDDGRWMLSLPAQPAGGPLELTVRGSKLLTLRDVLVGEVWLCSGQSNMEWTVARSRDPEKERAAAKYPMIRHIKIPRRPNGYPQDDVEADWTVCSPDTVSLYTAVGYYFGRRLHQGLDLPIGLVNSS